MKDIIICLFVTISIAIPVIFIMRDITDLHNLVMSIMEVNAKAFMRIDERLKKLENKKKKNKEEK